MKLVNEEYAAIRDAIAAGNYTDAFALKFWQLLNRVQQHLDAARLEIQPRDVTEPRPNLAALITDASVTLDAELASQGEESSHDAWAASLILRSLAGILNQYDHAAMPDETARALLLGFDLGAADSISGFVRSGQFDHAVSSAVLRERQSHGGKDTADWHAVAMRNYAARQERANPPGSLNQKEELLRAVETDKLQWSNKSDQVTIQKRAASLKKALSRKADLYSRIVAEVRAEAALGEQTPGGLQPFLTGLVKAVPK